MIPVRTAIKAFVIGVATFAVAFSLRRELFWDIKPVSWDYDPPQNGALEAAFLLLSIENIAAVTAAIALVLAASTWVTQRRMVARRNGPAR